MQYATPLQRITAYPGAYAPQGGVLSPLLMNVALHGLETVSIAVEISSKSPTEISPLER